jgi:putative two-component system response regulator
MKRRILFVDDDLSVLDGLRRMRHAYAHGLAGTANPSEARMVALSDAYDALCSERPYKPTYSEDEALETLRSEAGRRLVPEVPAAFECLRAALSSIRAELSDVVSASVAPGAVA